MITRGKRRVALFVPVSQPNGKAVMDVFTRWQGRLGIDDAFEQAVEKADQQWPGLDADPWHD